MNSSQPSSGKVERPPAIAPRVLHCPEAWKVDAAGMIAIALLSAVAYLAGVSPMLSRHAAVRGQQQELNAAKAKSADLQRVLATSKEQLALTHRALAAEPLRLERAASLNQRLAIVTDLAMQGGAGLDDVQPGKITPGPQYDAMAIHLAGTGSFPAFAALVHRLRNDFPDIGISGLEIAGSSQELLDTAKFSIDLLWYTQPAKPARPAAVGSAEVGSAPGKK